MELTHDLEILENFAAAIAKQAADDFIESYRYVIHHKAPDEHSSDNKIAEYNRAKWTVTECENFFRSNMFAAICPTLSPELLINELKKEARFRNKKKRKYGNP